jgi:hypothetical protein
MTVVKQFSIFMVNKPGILAKVLSEFAKSKVNIVAMTMMDSAEHGVMRIIFSKPDLAHDILERLNLPYNESNVLSVTLSNQTGALADVAEKLAKNHVNITYAYCTAGARGGKTTGVLKVTDIKKATKILETHLKKQAKSQRVARRAKAAKK